MLDIIHYYMDEDMAVTSDEQAQSKSGLREAVYRELYGTEYKYKYAKKQDKRAGPQNPEDYPIADDNFEDLQPFDPKKKQPTKGFVPATKFDPDSEDPFGGILDAPLSH